MQNKATPPSFDAFLLRMLIMRKLSTQQLMETLGLETANRILDNANNYMGIPSLGSGTAPVLHGQLHEFLGAIPDIKAQLADKMEKQMAQNQETSNQSHHEPADKPNPPKLTP
ncbi:hypothetical protein [Legionella londiniensis]|uniref:Uncharacterized protein n=1 Tax=Legionella londiniensis TaxID=45068 RepID=A0A0W0VTN3_9GAMM|nr:hypothetical protein [Legionella londiniensis]KTD23349.1 hypothetical protein Llon_0234 [Legionella londiniensis]STX94096.1 Uncharacterised protein [Legionella londiniensis]